MIDQAANADFAGLSNDVYAQCNSACS